MTFDTISFGFYLWRFVFSIKKHRLTPSPPPKKNQTTNKIMHFKRIFQTELVLVYLTKKFEFDNRNIMLELCIM